MKATISLVHPVPYRFEDTTDDYNLTSLFKSYLQEHYPNRINEFYPIIDQTDQYIINGQNVTFLESSYNPSQNYVITVTMDFPSPIPFNDELQNIFVSWLKDTNIWQIPGDYTVTYES